MLCAPRVGDEGAVLPDARLRGAAVQEAEDFVREVLPDAVRAVLRRREQPEGREQAHLPRGPSKVCVLRFLSGVYVPTPISCKTVPNLC